MQLAPDEYLVKVSYSAGPEGTGGEVKFHTQSQLDGTRYSASQTSQCGEQRLEASPRA